MSVVRSVSVAVAVVGALGLVDCSGGTPGVENLGGSGASGANGESGNHSGSRGSGSGGGSSSSTPAPELKKVDILFDIDNSASMGDKQAYLIEAVPQLVARLVTPRCIGNASQLPTGQNVDPSTGACATGSTPEFAPVHDMHIGVVTSSLGPRGGIQSQAGGTTIYICSPSLQVSSVASPSVQFNAHNDDQGHLINRTGPIGSGPSLANATLSEGGGFLYWFPALGNRNDAPVIPSGSTIVPETVAGNTGMPGTLVGDFSEVIAGAGESGCGIESQLESWYRFLVQPDPYLSIGLENNAAVWQGVDTTILQQRHDFLRPDSLVAVVVLTDENDSEIDARAFAGTGFQFLSDTYSPARATPECYTNPLDPGCQLCSQCGSACMDGAWCAAGDGVSSEQSSLHDWAYDLNLRHVHMAQKYSPAFSSAQYPLTRYHNGLTSPTVPDRAGEYPMGATSYVGKNDCTNPLFAATLPDASAVANPMKPTAAETAALCAGSGAGSATRTASGVFYAHIGGVPHQLLQASVNDGTGLCPPAGHTAGTPPAGTTCGATQYWDTSVSPASCEDCPQKDLLASADWVKILGKGPAAYTATNPVASYDYTGIDPHMIESEYPRNNNTYLQNPLVQSNPPESTLQGPGLGTGADPVRPDPINGREWTTNCSGCTHALFVDLEYACIFELPPSMQRDCATLPMTTVEGDSCACVASWGSGTTPAATGNTPDEIPPVCAKTSTDGTITSAVNDYTVQTYAKAYPTIRELQLANMMGAQGSVSSLCPIHTVDNATGDDPLYGYRPAMDGLVDRLKNALASQ